MEQSHGSAREVPPRRVPNVGMILCGLPDLINLPSDNDNSHTVLQFSVRLEQHTTSIQVTSQWIREKILEKSLLVDGELAQFRKYKTKRYKASETGNSFNYQR